MSDTEKYLLDADSLIRAKREHYAPDFCPGFWDALLRGCSQRRVASIVTVKRELLKGKDKLADWVKGVPEAFFESPENGDVQRAFSEVVQWVEDNSQFTRAAKQKFAGSADPWLIAYARSNKFVVVTYEVSVPDSKALIKLPDVARQFGVNCLPPYVMLRRLGIVLALS